MKFVHPCRISNGKLSYKQRSVALSDISKLKDGDYTYTLERVTKKRTLSQNAYLHLLIGLFTKELNELGNTFSEQKVKELLKFKFLKVDEIDQSTGEVIGQRIRHTSELNTEELNKFIDDIIQYGAEMFHFNLPYPNEQLTLSEL